MYIFFDVVRALIYPIYRLIFWVKIEGKENLPQDGCILCSNHISNLDPVFWLMGLRRPIHFMAKAELFKTKLTNWFFRKACAFPIERGKGDASSIKEAIKLINSGEILGIFPEGTRSKDGKPLRAKSGIALISHNAKSVIVPAAVICNGSVRPFKKIRLVIDTPVLYSKIEFEEINHRNLKNTSEQIMSYIIDILEREHGRNKIG